MFKCRQCSRQYRSRLHLNRKGICSTCDFPVDSDEAYKRGVKERIAIDRDVVATTETFIDEKISERHGIVSGQCVLGINVFKDISVSVTDFVGGESMHYQEELQKASQEAILRMKIEAYRRGANSVIAVNLDFKDISGRNMLFVVATGTAVTISRKPVTAC